MLPVKMGYQGLDVPLPLNKNLKYFSYVCQQAAQDSIPEREEANAGSPPSAPLAACKSLICNTRKGISHRVWRSF